MRNYDNSSAGSGEINENSRGTPRRRGEERDAETDIPTVGGEAGRRDRLIVTNTDPGLPNYKLMSRGNFAPGITFFPSARLPTLELFVLELQTACISWADCLSALLTVILLSFML